MSTAWEREFLQRMRTFEARRPPRPGEVSVSIKVRVTSGCFHRAHSPSAYALIDESLAGIPPTDFLEFEEHESGPELLVYVAAGVTLATSVINLIAAIIKARSDGVKKGDRPTDPIELIVRRVDDGSEYREEVLLRFSAQDAVSNKAIGRALTQALRRITKGKK